MTKRPDEPREMPFNEALERLLKVDPKDLPARPKREPKPNKS